MTYIEYVAFGGVGTELDFNFAMPIFLKFTEDSDCPLVPQIIFFGLNHYLNSGSSVGMISGATIDGISTSYSNIADKDTQFWTTSKNGLKFLELMKLCGLSVKEDTSIFMYFDGVKC